MTSEDQIEIIKEAQKKYYPGREVWHRATGEKHAVLYPFLDSCHRLCLRSVGWMDLSGAKNWTTTRPLSDGLYLTQVAGGRRPMTSEERIEIIKEAQKKYYPGRKLWHRKTGDEAVVLSPYIMRTGELGVLLVGRDAWVRAVSWTTVPPLPDGYYTVFSRGAQILVLKDMGHFYRFIPPGTRAGFYTFQSYDRLYRVTSDGDTVKFEKVELPEEGE